MKKLFCLLTSVLVVGCAPKNLINNKQNIPFVADGKANEWGDNLLYDPSSHLTYKVSSDDNNLYLMVKLANESLQRRMLTTGFTVWIDTTNRKKRNFGVTFPRGRMLVAGMFGPRIESRPKQRREHKGFDLKELLAESVHEIEIKAYDAETPRVMYISESKLKPVIGIDSAQFLVYEFTLPIGYFLKNRKSGKPISVGFVIGTENSQSGKSMSQEQGGLGGQMGGGMPGGGGPGMGGGMGQMGGDMSGGEMPQRASGQNSGDMEPVKCWLKNYVLQSSPKRSSK
jgi:hypothetical protein